MNMNRLYREAKRLHQLGFAIHWLHPNSKRPLESGWTTGPRKPWQYLKDTYSESLNVGVRLGTPSHIAGQGYLAVVDVDVKSTDPRHKTEAIAAAKKLLGGAVCPVALSGRGNGSRHYYCQTAEPFKTFNPAHSDEMIQVHMPSKRPSKKELEELTPAEIKQGLRISRAWEISLYSEGRQVVLPPSIHPDSNKPYLWKTPIGDVKALPLLKFEMPKEDAKPSPSSERSTVIEDDGPFRFEISPVQLDWLDVSDRIKQGIVHGTGVDDRSGFLLPAASALHSAGLSRDEILTVLTEPDTFLGACAYEHAKTQSRVRAAFWLWKYTVKRVLEERSAELAFASAAKIEPIRKLSEVETRVQAEEIEEGTDWRTSLDKTKDGKYRNTLNNCKLILISTCPLPGIVGRNEFAANDYYLCDTPWRSMKGKAISDIDIVRIKFFCAEQFGIEFNDNIIDQALQQIADKNRFHPVRDWLKSLKWDGTPRIDTWLKDYAGATGMDLYLSEVSRKVLCAMVGRVFRPGVKFDHMLILEGDQGLGKSTLLSKLAGPEWFSDATLNIGDKDAVLTMQSKWLVEMGELSSLGRAELEQVKVFVTQTTDRIRAPYGKRVEEFPRQSIFIGTTNQEEYLRDQTGNRRFWPVKVGKVDFNGVAKIRDQLFAEAVVYWNLGEPLYFDNPGVETEARFEQNKRSAGDEWTPIVRDILNSEGFAIHEFEMRDVAKRMDHTGAHRLSSSDVQRLTRCFKSLGCTHWRESKGARRRLWAYEIPVSEDVQGRPRSSKPPLDEKRIMNTEF